MKKTESPAPGLVATFFLMAESRGFTTLPDGNEAKAKLEWKMQMEIDELIESGIFRQRAVLADKATQPLFKMNREQVSRPSECRVLKVLRGNGEPADLKEAEVSPRDLDLFTICFACFFVRMGFYDAHCIEVLNKLRVVVAEGLRGCGHVIHDETIVATPARSMWAGYTEWACLARANGEHFSRIMASVEQARRSRIA